MNKANRCPECGGSKRGRGFSHKPGCKAMPASMKQHRAPKPRCGGPSASSKGIDLRSLRGMAVKELIALRGRIDELIKAKAPELQAEIKALQQTLAAIRGR